MADTMPFIIGEAAACDDGDCGEVSRFVVDPVALTMTHLVIAPKHGHQPGRLVPLSLVDDAARGVALRCTVAEFDKLDQAQETQYVPPAAGYDGHGPGRAGAQSLAPLSGGWGMAYGMSGRLGVASSTSPGSKNIAHTVVRDIVPAGKWR